MGNAVLDEVLAGKPAGLSLDDFEAAVDELSAAQRRRDERVERARSVLNYALTAPGRARELWQKLIRTPPSDLHQRRGLTEKFFLDEIEIIDDTAKVLPLAATLADGPLSGSEQLQSARNELVQFAEMILTRWTSQEELEELIVDTFELPEWLTKGPIPPHLQPPQSWYDETIDPSQPADA